MQRLALLGAALVFIVMSFNESAAIHERLQRTVDNRVLTDTTDHIYDGEVLAKVVVGLTAIAVAAFTVAIVLRTLRSIGRGRTAFGTGFVLLVIGAIGIDLTQEFLSIGPGVTAHAVFLEEMFEMVGVTLMIYGAPQGLACAPVTLYLGTRLHGRATHSSDQGSVPMSR